VSYPAALDEDAVIACADLAGRTGARQLELGYLHDEAPHSWYASASYKGARITVENQAGPVEAADAMARRLLDGARCTHCRRKVALSGGGAAAWVGGAAEHMTGLSCRWRRMGARWERGCAPGQAGA
jgi:hypothetical protein